MHDYELSRHEQCAMYYHETNAQRHHNMGRPIETKNSVSRSSLEDDADDDDDDYDNGDDEDDDDGADDDDDEDDDDDDESVSAPRGSSGSRRMERRSELGREKKKRTIFLSPDFRPRILLSPPLSAPFDVAKWVGGNAGGGSARGWECR